MGFALTDSAFSNSYGAGATGHAVEVDTAVGDLIIVAWGAPALVDPASVSDNAENDYTILDLVEDGDGGSGNRIAYCLSAKSAATITVTCTYENADVRMNVAVMVFHPDSGDTVSYTGTATKVGGWESSPWETASNLNCDGSDNVAVAIFQCEATAHTFSNHEIPAGTGATSLGTQYGSTVFYRIFADALTNEEAEVDPSESQRYSARVVAFKATAAAGGTIVPKLMNYYRRLRS